MTEPKRPGLDEAIVAWAVVDPGGYTYVPGDTETQAGTERRARAVATRNQGRGGEWSVVPLIVSGRAVGEDLPPGNVDPSAQAAHIAAAVRADERAKVLAEAIRRYDEVHEGPPGGARAILVAMATEPTP